MNTRKAEAVAGQVRGAVQISMVEAVQLRLV